MEIKKKYFGQTLKGEKIQSYLIKNDNNISIEIINYGAIITKIITPDIKGENKNIVLGYNNLSDYEKDKHFIGAIIGRYANRINNAIIKLNNKTYCLEKNDKENHLHGGDSGFHKKKWEYKKQFIENDSAGITLNYLSKDLEAGFPGNLNIEVSYTLNNNNEIKIKYIAKTDRDTHINITNHTYFNLSSNLNQNIFDHNLTISGNKYLEFNKDNIPTGKILDVSNSKFDFQKSRKISNELDNCWIIKLENNKTQKLAAHLTHEKTGRSIKVFTDEPGVQVYTGNNLNKTHKKNSGICIETQHFPDSPNNTSFPTTLLTPNNPFESNTTIKIL